MNEILNMTINEMPQTEFDCSCGRHHNFSVHDMSIRKGAIEDLPKMAEPFKDGKILVVYDNHTYEVAGRKAVQLLKDNGFNIKELMFDGSNRSFDQALCAGLRITDADIDVLCKAMKEQAIKNAHSEEQKVSIKDVGRQQLRSWGVLIERDGKDYPSNAYAILTGCGALPVGSGNRLRKHFNLYYETFIWVQRL